MYIYIYYCEVCDDVAPFFHSLCVLVGWFVVLLFILLVTWLSAWVSVSVYVIGSHAWVVFGIGRSVEKLCARVSA